MKILRVAPSDISPKTYTLQMTFDWMTNVLSGTVGTYLNGDGDLILDFNVNLEKWVGKILEFRIVMTEKGYELIYFNPLKNYAIANGMPSAPDSRRDMRMRVFRIFVDKNIEDSIIQVFGGHGPIEGFEDIVEDGDIELRMHNFIRRDKEAEHAFSMARLKSDMLGVVDQRDSVSYLEAQVDILTRLVLDLCKYDSSTLLEVLRKADEQSVLNIKGEEALTKEFTQKKAWVRTVQKDYYDAKQKLESEYNEANKEPESEEEIAS